MTDLCFLDATELARLIRAGELSPVQALRALRERQEEVGGPLNALVTPIGEAEEQARSAEAAVRRGEPLGALHGVPVSIKDTFDVRGARTTRGSLLFADRVAADDATTVGRLREAGAIPFAKSNTPEFALWWETDNRLFGRTVNPWNAERTAGGSSGGEAAAVAAGLSPLGLGSDLGGSIRLPAAHCGVVGLKPTHGRVPLGGHFPETILRFMHAGPIARSVRDAALALSVLGGHDPSDWHSLPVAPTPAEVEAGAPLRVGWAGAGPFGPVAPEVEEAVRGAAGALAAAGHAVERVELPWLAARDCNLLTLTLFGAEGRPFFAPLVAAREEELHWFLRRRLGLPLPSIEDYVAAEAEVEGLRRDLARFFEDSDALLCPVTPTPAHAHDLEELELGGERLVPRTIMRATLPFDLTGSPALAVPFALSDDGLPIGVQVVGRRFEDATVLHLGTAIEAARDPRLARPPSSG